MWVNVLLRNIAAYRIKFESLPQVYINVLVKFEGEMVQHTKKTLRTLAEIEPSSI